MSSRSYSSEAYGRSTHSMEQDPVLSVGWGWGVSERAKQNAALAPKELHMDTNTLLIIVVVLLLLGGGGWYGRGRWY
jgi:hypothetical protein